MSLRAWAGLAAILVLFIATAMLFVSRPGIEADEAVVITPGIYSWQFGATAIPLMHMSYYGALKTWVDLALFKMVEPGAISLRTPTILFGAGAIWLFFLLLDRTVGRRAAWIGALLLATDSMFVILEAIDYGPNALHFVWKLGAMVLLVRFRKGGSKWALAAAFFLVGLGLWDKVIFAWALFGVSLATFVVFPRDVWRYFTMGNLAIAAASVIAGALPLVAYNIARPFDTLKANAHIIHEPFAQKALILERTVNGAVLFGFFTSIQPSPHPGEANTWFEKTARAISEAAHHPMRNVTIAALCIAFLGLFARASRKPVLFGLLACALTWAPMVATAGAGGAAHHVILLWPFQLMAIAATLAALPWKWLSVAVTVVLCGSNLALTNEYYWELVHNGPDVRWTDALNPLEQRLERLQSPHVYVVDWGIVESILLLSDGAMPATTPDWSNADNLRQIIADPRAAFVAHTAKYAYFPQQRALLEDAAASQGYEEVPIEIVYDRNGRATFDVFRFRKIPL